MSTEYERFLEACPPPDAGPVERDLFAHFYLLAGVRIRTRLLTVLRREFFRRRLTLELDLAEHGLIFPDRHFPILNPSKSL